MPKHSVIIPCYNKENFIEATIASVLNQTDQSFEIIVVDDSSTDSSVKKVRQMAASDGRIRVMVQKNQGPAAARNTGLKVAKGKYVNFLDADDILAPRKLEIQGEYLDEHPEIGIVLCNGAEIDENDKIITDSYLDESKFKSHPPLQDVLFAGGLFPPTIMLCRRQQAMALGGYLPDREASGCEDLEFFIRLARAGIDYHIISQNLFRYRKVNGSWGSDPARMTPAHRYVYAKLMKDDPYSSACSLRYVHSLLRKAEAQLNGQRSSHALAMLLKLVSGWGKAQGKTRQMMLWGAGTGGQRILAILQHLGINISAFIDKDPSKTGSKIQGIAVTNPDTILHQKPAQRPFVFIGSTYWAQIKETLIKAGWQMHVDFFIFDFDTASILEDIFELPAPAPAPTGIVVKSKKISRSQPTRAKPQASRR